MISVVAKNARRIIDDKGLRHNAVAQKAGYLPGALSAMLCGRKLIKDTDIKKLALALEVSPNDLLGWNENRPAS